MPWIIGGVLMSIGVALMVRDIGNFTKAGTPRPTIKPTITLATTGNHSCTRNPIYSGMLRLYSGFGVATQSPWTLILAAPLAITICYGVVAREEAYLEPRFGNAHINYQ